MRMMRVMAVAALVACVLLAGCEGDDGAQGAVGPEGPMGPIGEDGNNGVTSITLNLVGRYESGLFDEGASEIVAYDPTTNQLFQVNAASGQVDVVDISAPSAPVLAGSIDVAAEIAANTTVTRALGSVNSVAVSGGNVYAAIEADAVDENGYVASFQTSDLSFMGATEVGVLPDSVAASPDGNVLVVANEGEPSDDYTVDPEGSISVINIADFSTAVVIPPPPHPAARHQQHLQRVAAQS